MNPTSINLFVADYFPPYDEDFVFSFALKKIGEIRLACGYTFNLPMPVKIEVCKFSTNKEVKKFFGGKKTTEINSYAYNLVFDKQLTDAEVNMWRMFKMGWRSARWPRY